MDTKNDITTGTIADKLAAAHERERRRALTLAQRPTPTGRMQMRRAMAGVEKLEQQVRAEAQAMRRARHAAELVGRLDSDLIAELAKMRAEAKR